MNDGRFQSRYANDIVKFFSKVKDTGTCWEWQGQRNYRGAGVFHPKVSEKKKFHPMFAHRWIWIQLNGSIPQGLLICHHCDNPPCVNPHHLFLGTDLDNHRDAIQKGRHTSVREMNKTHCKYDHPRTLENTYTRPNGARLCRECARIYDRLRRSNE